MTRSHLASLRFFSSSILISSVVSVVSVVSVITVGCGGGTSTAGAPEEATSEPAPQGAAPNPGAGAAKSDPLLTRARTAMQGGKLPPSLRAQILASRDPAHARAKALLSAIDRGEGESGSEAESETPAVPSIAVKAPSESPSATTTAASEPVADPDEDPEKPAAPAELAVVTRLSLAKAGGRAHELIFHASESIEVGVVRQEASGLVRFVVKSSGALPAVLRARPTGKAFTVTDVRRGDGTVQVTLRPHTGWKFRDPQPFPGGAKVRFEPG